MQWIKQTFSFRINVRSGRHAHLLGLRYESESNDWQPPPEAKPVDWDAVTAEAAKDIPVARTYTSVWDSLRVPELRLTSRISLRTPVNSAFPPG
jgi:hypothetical protein